METDDLIERLMGILVSDMIGVLMIFSHEFVDTILKAVLYYILTLFEGVGISVPMTYTNVAIIAADAVLTVAGTIIILLSGLALLMIIKNTMNGTYI